MKKREILILSSVLAGLLTGAAVGWFYWTAHRNDPPAAPKTAVAPTNTPPFKMAQVKRPPTILTNRSVRATNAVPRKAMIVQSDLPAALQPVAEKLQQALDDDKTAEINKLAKEMLASDNQEARIKAVEALGFAGWDGLTTLTTLLLDPDPEVAEAARSAWQFQLSEMDDTNAKLKMMAGAATLVAEQDSEFLEELLTEYGMEAEDKQRIDLALSLYTEQLPDASKKVIVEALDEITQPDNDSSNIEEARKAIETWRKENADTPQE